MLGVLFGPSGAGKSSIIELLGDSCGISIIVPEVTRLARAQKDIKTSLGVQEFLSRAQQQRYIWVNSMFGGWYGTVRRDVESALATRTVSHVLDYPLERYFDLLPCAGRWVGVFVMPPSWEELARRLDLGGRTQRLATARSQYDFYHRSIRIAPFDSHPVVINVDLVAASGEVATAFGLTKKGEP